MDGELFTLIEEAKNGNKEAFKELITRYKGIVFRQAFAMLHERMEAEDVTQEAFIKVYYSLAQLASPFAFFLYFGGIITTFLHVFLSLISLVPIVIRSIPMLMVGMMIFAIILACFSIWSLRNLLGGGWLLFFFRTSFTIELFLRSEVSA